MRPFHFARVLPFAILSAGLTFGQTSTSVTLNITQTSYNYMSTNSLIFSQTGSVGSLGNATLVATSSAWPIDGNSLTGPVQATLGLSFNLLDSIQISFTIADPDFANVQNFTMSGGTITGGTGIYTGATGSLTLNVAKTGDTFYNRATTTGLGSLTVGA